MALEIEGRIKQILPAESGVSQSSGKEWRKQQFVITTLEEFPRNIVFTTWNDNTYALQNLKVGEKIKIRFRAESREYNGRWYTDLVAWQITKIVEEAVVSPNRTVEPTTQPTQTKVTEDVIYNEETQTDDTTGIEEDLSLEDSETDDLPF